MELETYWTRKQAAAYIRSVIGQGSEQGLANHANRGTGPAYHLFHPRLALYSASDVKSWITERLGPAKKIHIGRGLIDGLSK